MTYSFHPEADTELFEAFANYRDEGGVGIARLFLNEVGRVADLLVANPGLAPPWVAQGAVTRFGSFRTL